MKIGFDAKRAFLNTSGLGNYSRQLIGSLMNYFPRHEYVLFTPKTSDLFHPSENKGHPRLITPRGIWKTLPSVWRSSRIISDIRKEKIELYHGLSNELPFGIKKSGSKSIVTIHDLIFLRHPAFYPAADRNVYLRKSKYSCKNADHIIAVSKQTKEDVVHFYQVQEEKISVICQSIHPSFLETATHDQLLEARRKFRLPEKFILSVGTIEERKNLLSVLNALDALGKEHELALVVIGKITPYKKYLDEFIAKHLLQKKVIFLQNVSNEELPFVYQCASVLVYPSRFEGFGLPVAEALAAGVPVIATDEVIFHEAGGSASVYVNPDNKQDFSNAISRVMNDGMLRKKMIEEGKEHAENFKPQKQAMQLMELYERVLKQ